MPTEITALHRKVPKGHMVRSDSTRVIRGSFTKETRDQAKENNIYPNHILSLQDKGKVLTICKKTTIFF